MASLIYPDFTISLYCTAVHVIMSFSASFSLLCFLSISLHPKSRIRSRGLGRKKRRKNKTKNDFAWTAAHKNLKIRNYKTGLWVTLLTWAIIAEPELERLARHGAYLPLQLLPEKVFFLSSFIFSVTEPKVQLVQLRLQLCVWKTVTSFWWARQ